MENITLPEPPPTQLIIPDNFIPNLKGTWYTDKETEEVYSLKELKELLCNQN